MTEVIEGVTLADVLADLDAKCPFKEPEPEPADEEAEHPVDDDLKAAESIQENNGGTLGTNLVNASPGKALTLVKPDKYPPPSIQQDRLDTRRSPDKPKVKVKGDSTKELPFTVAAHHCIPGNGSLKASDLYQYMIKGGEVPTATKKFTLEANIGYNVNGSHNGVWLPGNYAINKSTSPTGQKWSELIVSENANWCFDYMVAVTKKTMTDGSGGQFHDTHSDYNLRVKGVLNKIHAALVVHQDSCTECQSKDTILPPYKIKLRLFNLSQYLRQELTRPPGTKKTGWKWFTSDRFVDQYEKPFCTAYELAKP